MLGSRLDNRRLTTPAGAKPELNTSANAYEGEYTLSLYELFRVIRKYLFLVVLVTIVAVGVALSAGVVQTPNYEASIKILVG